MSKLAAQFDACKESDNYMKSPISLEPIEGDVYTIESTDEIKEPHAYSKDDAEQFENGIMLLSPLTRRPIKSMRKNDSLTNELVKMENECVKKVVDENFWSESIYGRTYYGWSADTSHSRASVKNKLRRSVDNECEMIIREFESYYNTLSDNAKDSITTLFDGENIAKTFGPWLRKNKQHIIWSKSGAYMSFDEAFGEIDMKNDNHTIIFTLMPDLNLNYQHWPGFMANIFHDNSNFMSQIRRIFSTQAAANKDRWFELAALHKMMESTKRTRSYSRRQRHKRGKKSQKKKMKKKK